MLKSIAAIVAAAAIAGALTGFPDLTVPVNAAAPTAGEPTIAAPACPDRGWPYRHCGGDGSGLNGARLVTTDRLQ